MELELKKNEAAFCKCSFEAAAKQNIELELSLPDYCSDIKRILKCIVVPSINGVSLAGERATATGDVRVRLIYVNDSEKIDCYEQSSELSVYVDIPNVSENGAILAAATVEYVNCRAASQRRFSVNGTVSVSFKAYMREKKQLLCEIEGLGSQTKKETTSCVKLVSLSEKCFDLSETVALPPDSKPVGKIIRADPCATIHSLKAVSGKLLIKGDYAVDILYCADSSDSTVEHLVHTMPISQIADVPDIDENSLCDVVLAPRAIDVELRADSSGSNRLLEIAAKVSAFTKAYETKEQQYITDCYSTKVNLASQFGDFDFYSRLSALDRKQAVKKTVELNGQSAKQIVDVRAIKISCTAAGEGSNLAIRATATFSIFFKDKEDKFQYCERSVDFDLSESMEGYSGKVFCEPIILAQNIKPTVLSEDKIEIGFDCAVSGEVYSVNSKRVCINSALDEAEAEEEKSALIICYSQKGEDIWSIAKMYKTTCDAIREENSLKGDFIDEDRMLMVPCV